jgi:hypothetical protein
VVAALVSIRAFDGPCSQYAAVMLDRCAAHAAAHEAPPAFGYVLELQPFTVTAAADGPTSLQSADSLGWSKLSAMEWMDGMGMLSCSVSQPVDTILRDHRTTAMAGTDYSTAQHGRGRTEGTCL